MSNYQPLAEVVRFTDSEGFPAELQPDVYSFYHVKHPLYSILTLLLSVCATSERIFEERWQYARGYRRAGYWVSPYLAVICEILAESEDIHFDIFAISRGAGLEGFVSAMREQATEMSRRLLLEFSPVNWAKDGF